MSDNGSVVSETMMPVNGIEVCVETFGEPDDPAVLLIAGGASSMDWWEDEFCRRLAAGGRFVIRYDHRDTGRSTCFPAGAPPYSGLDLAHDALGVLDALGVHRAHVVGLSMGGALAQIIAVERPHRLLSLTLMSTSAGSGPKTDTDTASDTVPGGGSDSPPETGLDTDADPGPGPGPADAASGAPGPQHEEPVDQPDWSDRRTAVDCMISQVREAGGPFTADEPHLRRLAERVYDRTTDMAATQCNHWLAADGPPVRHRLGSITVPTLILHGTQDPLFPAEHARALAAEIPGARLVWLDGVGHEFPPAAVWSTVIHEILGQAARGRQPA
jgi:pimeloyl-ACP methyl ester carboxylesterase